MPVKRRLSKRRTAGAPPEAWAMLFSSGFDYLSDLADYGLPDDASAREAAGEAWEAFGQAFMQSWQGTPAQPLPWAAEAFGMPWEEDSHAD